MKTIQLHLIVLFTSLMAMAAPASDCAPTPSGLVSWWRAEVNADDSMGSNHGSLRNGAGFAAGMVGQAFSLNGASQFVLIPANGTLNMSNALTIELWFKVDNYATGRPLIDKRNGGVNCNYGIIPTVEYGLQVFYDDPAVADGDFPGSGFVISALQPEPSAGVFHHLAATYEQADAGHIELKTYLDGALLRSRTYLGVLARTVNNAPLSIGAEGAGAGAFFKGLIDEVSLYNRALTLAEIQSVFNAGSAGKCTTPVAPAILGQPENVSVVAGGTATFSVTATGTAPLQYQWRFQGADITGATQSSLALLNAQPSQAGGYSVVVANLTGSVTSSVATLTVTPPPSTIRVASLSAVSGGTVFVPVELIAQGAENAVGFSLNFDAALLKYVDTILGSGVPPGTILVLNTNSADIGKVGIAVALPPNTTLASGTREVVLVQFAVASVSSATNIPVTFGDLPTTRQVSDAQAQVLPSVFEPGQVTIGPSTVRIQSTTAASGGEASVSVFLVAQGNENAVAFSVNFNSQLIALNDAVLGVDVPAGATLIVNSNNASDGRVGIAVALAADTQFSPGTQQVAVIHFTVAPVLNGVTTPITFGDQPTTRQLSDVQARVLPSLFASGDLVIVDVQFEGDAAPRPGGDRALTVIDWVQLGRFVAGLDTPSSPEEFQRIDCAPRATKGNGAITVTDYVQAGRYMVGLDPVTPVGGPTSAGGGGGGGGGAFVPAGSRTMWVGNASVFQGQTNTLTVALEASGRENAAAFSVNFDATKLRYVSATNGSATATASLTLNANEVMSGRLGVVVALAPGTALKAGTQELIKIQFATLASAPSSLQVGFGDAPVVRETSDASAGALTTSYSPPATVSVILPNGPPLQFLRSGNTLVLSWPVSAAGFELEGTVGALGSGWSAISSFPIGDQKISVVPIASGQQFFRLKKP